MVKGTRIGGFALMAAPAEYRVTGVKTFIVSNDGVVYQKDLGPQTLENSRKPSYSIQTGHGLEYRSTLSET